MATNHWLVTILVLPFMIALLSAKALIVLDVCLYFMVPLLQGINEQVSSSRVPQEQESPTHQQQSAEEF